MTTLTKFEQCYITEPNSGCFIWLGKTNNAGYGYLERQFAHRLSWSLSYGEIPKGECVLHKCDVRLCVNPLHLYLGNHRQNMKDAIDRGRWEPYLRLSKVTSCKHGHEYTPENTRVYRGVKFCRECHRQYQATHWRDYYRTMKEKRKKPCPPPLV